jgi:hypothetical protein
MQVAWKYNKIYGETYLHNITFVFVLHFAIRPKYIISVVPTLCTRKKKLRVSLRLLHRRTGFGRACLHVTRIYYKLLNKTYNVCVLVSGPDKLSPCTGYLRDINIILNHIIHKYCAINLNRRIR